MALFRPEQLGVITQRQDPETQFLSQDGYYRTAGGGGGGTVTSVGLSAPTELQVTGSPVTTSGTLALSWVNQSSNEFFAGPTSGPPGTPGFRSIVVGDLAGTPAAGTYWDGGTGLWTALPAPGTGTVTSVNVAVPTELLSSGGPITTSGTITLSWVNETSNRIFAGPSTGPPGTPSFRSMVNADLPDTAITPGSYTYASVTFNQKGVATAASSGTAPVTSVGLSLPAEFTVSNSPVTSTGTLTAVWANESANRVFAGPSTGPAATPTFRALVVADLPAGTGTVTSVALAVPAVLLTVSGSPITTSGTITVALATQSANLFLLGPASGSAATPTFRAVVPLDLGSNSATAGLALVSTGPTSFPQWIALSGTAIGFTTGKDKARPAANTTNIYFTTDTVIGVQYMSNGTDYFVPGCGKDKVALGQIAGGVGGFSDANYFQSAAAGGVSTTMKPGTFCLLFYCNSLPGAANLQMAGYSQGNIVNGWALKCSAVNANQFACLFTGLNSTGNIQLPGPVLTTGVHCFIFTYDNATTIKYCLDGGTVSSATVSGTFTAPTSGSAFGIGRFLGASGLASGWFDYVAHCAWSTVLSNADMQALSGSASTFRFGSITTDYDWFQYGSWISLAGAAAGAGVFPMSGVAAIGTSYISAQGSGLRKANY